MAQNEKSSFSLDKLDDSSKEVIRSALTDAKSRNHKYIRAENMLMALLIKDYSLSNNAKTEQLESFNIDIERLKADLESQLNPRSEEEELGLHETSPSADADLSAIFNNLGSIGRKITLQDLWVEILLSDSLSETFERNGLDKAKKIQLAKLWGVSNAEELDPDSFVAKYCKDLTSMARKGELGPIVGRDDEIRQAQEALQRMTKNNPVFVGETGVGKTAIAHSIAIRMAQNEVPDSLQGKSLVALDISSLISGGPRQQGSLEDRARGLVKELKSNPNIVLFIDDMHLISGHGEGNRIGQILKPAITSGEIRCIGASSPDEYRQFFEKESSFERTFQKIKVEEPSVEDAISILRGIKESYSLHHGVEISDSAICAAVELSKRYIADKQLPEKAIDLMDAAAAKVRTVLGSKPELLEKMQRQLVHLEVQRRSIEREKEAKGSLDLDTQDRLVQLEQTIKELSVKSEKLLEKWNHEKEIHEDIIEAKTELAKAQANLEVAKREQNLITISELQYGLIPQLEEDLATAKSKSSELIDPLIKDVVGANEIAEIVSRKTGVPLSKMKDGEQERLADMEEILGKSIIGQDEAVEAVSTAVRRSRAGLADPKKPIGSFMFLGASGVGKTELAKELAKFMFDRTDAIVRFDMSEFMDKSTVSRLLGAPPGYVGYEEGGMLTEAVKNQPYSLILFDEVEKAHPDVFNILLQLLDDGRLTDSKGRTVDFKNTIVIMTSNLGAHNIHSMAENGATAEEIKEAVLDAQRGHFRPEFLNRIDESIVFNALKLEHITKIGKILCNKLTKRIYDNKKVKITLSDSAIALISQLGFDPLMGARPLSRAIQEYLEAPLSTAMFTKDPRKDGKSLKGAKLFIREGDEIEVDATDGKLVFVNATVERESGLRVDNNSSDTATLDSSSVSKRAKSKRVSEKTKEVSIKQTA